MDFLCQDIFLTLYTTHRGQSLDLEVLDNFKNKLYFTEVLCCKVKIEDMEIFAFMKESDEQ